jgi:RNA polymerase sigma-70 factor (ECF subfamily)
MDGKRYWESLFSRHRSGLTAFFRRRLRGASEAQDLTQEVYLRLLRADRNEQIRNPKAYLYAVALNLVREQAVLEERWRRTVDVTDVPADPALVVFRTPDEEIDEARRLATLAQILEGLPPKPRAVLLLQFRDGLTYEEIAQQLGTSTHWVKKYVVQGLALCRQRISPSLRTSL